MEIPMNPPQPGQDLSASAVAATEHASVDATSFNAALFSYLASPEGRAELKPLIDQALSRIGNPFVKAAAAVVIEVAIETELARLAGQ